MKNDLPMNVYGNVWFFPVVLKAGEVKHAHKHEFDHVHQALSGRAKFVCYDDYDEKKIRYEVEMESGKIYAVPKDLVHEIVAITDYRGQCLHALRHDDGTVVETNMVTELSLKESNDLSMND